MLLAWVAVSLEIDAKARVSGCWFSRVRRVLIGWFLEAEERECEGRGVRDLFLYCRITKCSVGDLHQYAAITRWILFAKWQGP